VISHSDLEKYLGRYSGLMLYLREMDESAYGKICGVILYFLPNTVTILFLCPQAYFSAASDLHNTQIKALLSTSMDFVKKATDEEIEQGKSHQKCSDFLKTQTKKMKCRINDDSKTCHATPCRYRHQITQRGTTERPRQSGWKSAGLRGTPWKVGLIGTFLTTS